MQKVDTRSGKIFLMEKDSHPKRKRIKLTEMRRFSLTNLCLEKLQES